VKVINAEATKTSNDKPMFKVKFEITEGPHAPRKVYTNLTVSEENPMALAIFFRQMDALGLNSSFFGQGPTPDQVASALINRPARVTVGTKTWNGVERNEVKSIAPPLGGSPMAPGVAAGNAPLVPAPGATPSRAAAPSVGPGPSVGSGPAAPSGPPALPI